MAISGYQRYCLNMQGYSQLTDEAKARIDLAQRFKPAICAALTVAAFFSQSAPFAFLLALLGYWAAFFPNHPVDLVYAGVIRPALRAPDLGADPVPRRFACGMAATLILIGAVAWQAGATIVGSIFVGMTALALLTLTFADFCVGSLFYWLLVRRQIFRGT
ncbi:MAG: DUF4395 family protein [Chloroflexi bacterium]|nr:DUF4395 family protein [Chloroflexota bacterium]